MATTKTRGRKASAEAEPFAVISAEAERIGWPKAYRGDLEHDRAMLADRSPSVPFLWSIRETGTHLVYIDTARDADWARACAQSDGDRARYYVWNGTELQPVRTAALWIDMARGLVTCLPRWNATATGHYPYSRPMGANFTVRASSEAAAKDYAQQEAKAYLCAGYREVTVTVVAEPRAAHEAEPQAA